ncbi:LysM peptidoglycan-binding domain-containing protein [Paenibacillus hamazuiensis]|uniref:LysM peptidoglycan-binding domain-containing protein n=1 Tax=Paenibacillus hamazuiensis TaxID=2936508 RepID=UPI00200DF7AF|nr:LysM peptidoglycan-binding domain-containing protein [Paenibacillus hamazuiensis]
MYTNSALVNNKADTSVIKHKKLVRFLFVLFVVSIIFTFSALVTVYASGESASVKTSGTAETRSVVVMPGDTLWSIASANKTRDQDIRTYIDKIKEANKLKSSVLKEGQLLFLP